MAELLSCPRHPRGGCSCLADVKQGRNMIAAARAAEESAHEQYEWVPEAGWVLVLRMFVVEEAYRKSDGKVALGLNDQPIIKPIAEQRLEEFKNKLAVVLKVGDTDPRTGEMGRWTEGQDVLIEPSVFREVMLGGGKTVWLGPFCGIIAHVEKVKDQEVDREAN